MVRYLYGFVACVCLSLVVVSGAQAKTHLQVVGDVFANAYANGEAEAVQRNVKLFKEADLSFQGSLVTPFMPLGDCKSQSELGVLMGMYQFDSNYALVFGKKNEFVKARRAMAVELKPRMEVFDTLEFTPVSPELIKEVAQNPNDLAKRDELYTHFQRVIDQTAEQAGKDEAVLMLVTDTAYGTVLQGMYVAASLALQAKMEPKLSELFADQKARMARLVTVYNAMQNELVDRGIFNPERFSTILALHDILQDSNNSPSSEELEKMLDIASRARAGYVSECK